MLQLPKSRTATFVTRVRMAAPKKAKPARTSPLEKVIAERDRWKRLALRYEAELRSLAPERANAE
jgi:hypothetical protein